MAPGFRKSVHGAYRSLVKTIKGTSRGFLGEIFNKHKDPIDKRLDRLFCCTLAYEWPAMALGILFNTNTEAAAASFRRLQEDYHVSHVYNFKKKLEQSQSEHEFIVVRIASSKYASHLLRIDRCVGISSMKPQRSRTPSVSSNTSCSQVSQSSFSVMMEEALDYQIDLHNHCRCFLHNVEGYTQFGQSTCYVLDKMPSTHESHLLRTIEYRGASPQGPNLWNFVHILGNIEDTCMEHRSMVDAQCYWYADMIFTFLESWSKPGEAKVTRHYEVGDNKAIPAPGTLAGVTTYTRNEEELSKIKDSVTKNIRRFNDVAARLIEPEEARRKAAEIERICARKFDEMRNLHGESMDEITKMWSKNIGDITKIVQQRADERVELLTKRLREDEERVGSLIPVIHDVMTEAKAVVLEANTVSARMQEAEARLKEREERWEQLAVRLEKSEIVDHCNVL
ncbi:hypothetical protein AMATHDRAFT_5616 [Amanita thiersii Skay4041]|uniref:Uncharacterized protein n=1 Tax=Amanita thiersii Skay4041 TaxID=703135 RepID=A0A2A9NLL8_9AGAR|nr:hypothetical protein AMATHDRAFT_5616 [Amanita thiersii Skay4041]